MIGWNRNPTPLKVGASGLWKGRQAEVVGRARIRNDDRYQWNEYYVQVQSGPLITLVYEAGVWKSFEYYTPQTPFSAHDAAGCRVGDFVSVGTERIRVAYCSESEVVYVEGQALEGMKKGSRATYFNGERDEGLFVASWTGDEIEFFVGKPVPRNAVGHAFGFSENGFLHRAGGGGSGALHHWLEENAGTVAAFSGVGILLLFAWAQSADWKPVVVDPAPVKLAPAVQLTTGADGVIAGRRYQVDRHWLIEIDQAGLRFDRHEYDLIDPSGGHALLVQGLAGDPKNWLLFVARPDWQTLTPLQAGQVQTSTLVNHTGHSTTVQALFLSRSLETDGEGEESFPRGSECYGYLASGAGYWEMARWTTDGAVVQQGYDVSGEDVAHAFRH